MVEMLKPLVTTKWPGPAAAETSLIKRPLTCEFMGWESGRHKNGSLRMGGRGSATRRKGQGSGSAQCFMISRQRSTQATSRICNCRISSGVDQRISSRSATTLILPPHIPGPHLHKERDAWTMDSGPHGHLLELWSKRYCQGSWTQGAKTWIETKKQEKRKKAVDLGEMSAARAFTTAGSTQGQISGTLSGIAGGKVQFKE